MSDEFEVQYRLASVQHSRDTRYVIECLNGAARQSWNRPTDRPTQGQAVASNFRWWYPRIHTGMPSSVRRRKRGHPFSRPRGLFLSFMSFLIASLFLSDRIPLFLPSTNRTRRKRRREYTAEPTITLTIGTYVDRREMTENRVWHREVPTSGKAL